ncbi:hypothetical protein [Roseateles terrae]|uniref:Tetratricopeptide (TPR) repeat protein n=1 Tax=Roseateles terrae TaxID=431060 RepID=A0ABR6GQX3_9BURK|nr:hypothetical protein [Roseateles terrae]MBB3194512.1 tetratricopeptide (TPR) repeat protein [Roseateles terrae]OWQ83478.1 hypothetical protein CDN98_22490 [Roseateles terrae]
MDAPTPVSSAAAAAVKSRLFKQLDQQVATAQSPMASVAPRARRAMQLARHGALSEAREALTVLHQLSFQHPHAEIGAWLHLAEGLMAYYNGFAVQPALERITRAHAIATAHSALGDVQVLADAWLAQLAYVRHELDALIHHARRCLAQARPEVDHGALARLSMALGVAWHFTGDSEVAQRWYQQARRHATAEGDDTTLSALMYNMAAMRVAQLRRDSLNGAVRVQEMLLSVDSVDHYDAAVGAAMMNELTPVLRAQVLTVEGRFEQARQLYEQHLPQAMAQGLERLGSSLLSDMAWCRANSGQQELALLQAREAEIELDPSCDLDDRAITHSRLAQVFRLLGQTDDAQRHEALADEVWGQYAAHQQHWRQALSQAGLSASH